MNDEEECEMEDHDPRFPKTPAIRLPRNDFGSFAICEACMEEVFKNIVKPTAN